MACWTGFAGGGVLLHPSGRQTGNGGGQFLVRKILEQRDGVAGRRPAEGPGHLPGEKVFQRILPLGRQPGLGGNRVLGGSLLPAVRALLDLIVRVIEVR